MLIAKCMDCGKDYKDFGLDVYMNDFDWSKINPNKNGLLCANCIIKRAAKLAGVIVIKMELDYREDNGDARTRTM